MKISIFSVIWRINGRNKYQCGKSASSVIGGNNNGWQSEMSEIMAKISAA
jgi:hypothetical protein